MQEKHLFEYAIIRVVPRVEREEFLNAGVILYCRSKRFLQTIYTLDEPRIKAFTAELDIKQLEKRLQAFVQICQGTIDGGPIGKLDLASRFRWLTATRSTVVQSSSVHPGLCLDPSQMLVRLHAQLVQ